MSVAATSLAGAPPGVPALLDPRETTKHLPAVVELLDYKRRRAYSLLDCAGSKHMFYFCQECGELHEKQLYCASRLCETCRPKIARRRYAAWMERLAGKNIDDLALITLTQTARTNKTLKQLYDSAYTLSKKLMRQKIWTETVSGCLRVIEVKPSRWAPGRWNVHIHILADAKNIRIYRTKSGRREAALHSAPGSPQQTLDKRRLSAAWRALTGGDSYIVDVIPCFSRSGDVSGALSYVMKYVFKAQDFSAETDQGAGMILDYQKAMKGKRMVQALGRWYAAHKQYSLRHTEVKIPECSCGGKFKTSFQVARERDERKQLTNKYNFLREQQEGESLLTGADMIRLQMYGLLPLDGKKYVV